MLGSCVLFTTKADTDISHRQVYIVYNYSRCDVATVYPAGWLY